MPKKRILIVEDERISAENIKLNLGKLGYSVSAIATTGSEAIKAAKEYKTDLVLMDIQLQDEMDGIEAAQQIRAHMNIPVVYLTAYADPLTLARAKITEPFGYILKPFEGKDLHSAIEIALYKHRMEKRWRETQEWLSTTLKSIGDAVIATDADGLVTHMNLAAEVFTGWKQEEVVGEDLKTVFNIVNKKTERKIHDLVGTAIKHGSVFKLPGNLFLSLKNKKEIRIDASCIPVRDDGGNINEVIVAFRDISAQKQTEESLKTSRANFCSIVEMSPDGIIIVDRAGIVQFMNPAAEIFIGRKEKDLLEKKFIYDVAANEVGEIEIKRLDGNSGVGELRADKTDWNNKPSYLVVIRDVTERKQKLAELENALFHQIRTKDQFLSHVAHELRTPLSVIHQFSTILLDGLDGKITEAQREDLEIVLRNTNKLSTMIKDLLDGTRAITGKLTIDPQPISVSDVIAGVSEVFHPRTRETGISLRLDVPGDLPSVYADPSRLEQVLSNLMDNAVKFTPQKGRISIHASRFDKNASFVLFEVKNTGCGIHPQEKKKVFDYLYQAQVSQGDSRKGLGLGLFICKEIITQHGGEIWVKSGQGRGCTFCFTIPVFSLKKILGSLLTPGNCQKSDLALITVSVCPSSRALPLKILENANHVVWDVLKNCISSESEVLLPRNNSHKRSEIFSLVLWAEKQEALQKIKQIEKELEHCEILFDADITTSVSFSVIDVLKSQNSRKLDRIVRGISNRIKEIERSDIFLRRGLE